jgi:FixJ family two-component response regulator
MESLDRLNAEESVCMPNRTPSVFVVDADPSTRIAMETLLRRAGWKVQLFASSDEFLARAPRLVPGCLIVGVSVSDPDALNTLHRIAADRRETPIIVLSNQGDIPFAVLAIKAGAVEFLTKPFADEVVLATVSQTIGRSQAILQQEAELFELRSRLDSLSQREREVMARIVAGDLNKQAGAILGISEITVKAHRGRVMRKMLAHSLADLVRMALQLRLPSAPPAAMFGAALSQESHRIAREGEPHRPVPGVRRPQPIRIAAETTRRGADHVALV